MDEFVAETKVNSEFNVFKLNQDKKRWKNHYKRRDCKEGNKEHKGEESSRQ